MKKLLIAALTIAVCITGTTYANATYTFDFNPLSNGASPSTLNAYMTGIYGSTVTAQSAYVFSGDGFGTTAYITTRPTPGSMDIWFTNPISSVSFDGYVFEATPGADLNYKAFDSGGNIVDASALNPGTDGQGSYSSGLYATSVYYLEFSNEGAHDIGVDNIQVTSASNGVPVPGSMTLSAIGLAVVNWMRKRKTI